jgi:hypothetical protein
VGGPFSFSFLPAFFPFQIWAVGVKTSNKQLCVCTTGIEGTNKTVRMPRDEYEPWREEEHEFAIGKLIPLTYRLTNALEGEGGRGIR